MQTSRFSQSKSLVWFSGYATAEQPGIHAYLFDENSGDLSALSSFTGIHNPSYIALQPNGRWLYAVSETSQAADGAPGRVCALSFEREPFEIKLLNHQPSGGDWPCHVCIDASGRWVFTANYGSGSASLFPIRADGSLGEISDHVQHAGAGPNTARQEGPHAHSVTLSPDNRFALVADLGLDQIVSYRFDAEQGRLEPHGQTQATAGAGPRHLAFHPNGRWLYVSNELDNSIRLYAFDADSGALSEDHIVSSLPDGAPENTLADIRISATGERVYASNRGHNSLAVYSTGADGRLELLGIPDCGGEWPRSFALSPGGRFVLVANQTSQQVSVLPVLPGAPGLGAARLSIPIPGASCIQFA
jgi:6-phosphogluconolactonase